MRIAKIVRQTKETSIEIELNLDGSGVAEVDTGIGFLDHMLEQVAVHGLFDLRLKATGDLHVDPHHTVEDCAIVLGKAVEQALEDKAGIVRMASMHVPMDDALAFIVIDLSGRPYAIVETKWCTPAVGGIAVSLIDHFLESFAMSALCNLHARTLYARNDHHQAEALFKALGRTLDAATRIDARRANNIPSTKGVL